MKRMKIISAATLVSLALLMSCSSAPNRIGQGSGGATGTGSGSGDDSNPSSPGHPSQQGGQVALSCSPTAELDPGPAPLKRLSKVQYINSVRHLLGDLPILATTLSSQQSVSAIGNVLADVSKTDVEGYFSAAESIAKAFVSDKAKLTKVFNCDAAANKKSCVETAFTSLAAKALRTPMVKADSDRYLAIYDLGAKVNHEHGIELLISSLLQSPKFLYQFEFGTEEKLGSKAVRLSPYEIATRLSFALWNSVPDDRLLQAAAEGKLSNSQGVQEQVEIMLKDPRGKDLLIRFLEEWSEVDKLGSKAKDSALFPEWNDAAFRKAVHDQSVAFFRDIVDNKDASLTALLTSKTIFTNKKLASVYGGSASSDEMKAEESSEKTTSGILTLPGLLAMTASASESSPVYRGRFVRESLLCQELPPAPADIPPAPSITPGVSTRERANQHEADPRCSGCHVRMDPIGFGFENFDAIGRVRATDGGKPVDISGEVFAAFGIEGKFHGAAELGQKLAKSEEVKDCMTKLWFRFLLSRFEDKKVDACALEQAGKTFREAELDIKSLPAAVTGSGAFQYRRPIKP